MTSTHPTPNETRANLSTALTFHASFDHGPDADFALGDKQVYTAEIAMGEIVTGGTPGIGAASISIAEGAGKYGDALAFTQASNHILLYKAEKNVAYSPQLFRGTASFWMRLDPAEIDGQYADPFQMTDKIYSDDCIWIDFTKNDTPSDFRLGVFGDRATWDVNKLQAQSKEFYWRLAKVTEPPFAKDRWTHVVITWDGLNNSQNGRARLYFDAEYQAASGIIRERFNWDVANATIRLGTGPFVGLMDDLAIFNRPLTAEEIRVLYELDRGVTELHP
ncbi:MAG: LamG domain-containing protein [Caldilineaceae bacterium]|nr:LamG domain-containing protein [Caldilineaceae bacterium]